MLELGLVRLEKWLSSLFFRLFLVICGYKFDVSVLLIKTIEFDVSMLLELCALKNNTMHFLFDNKILFSHT